MVPADRILLELVSDGVCHSVLTELLAHGPRTQRELAAAAGVGSGAMSRRMADLERGGLVSRERSHGPYELVLPRQTRALMEQAKALAEELLALQYAQARADTQEFRKAGMRGGHLRDQKQGR